ncbi:hypothetical protein DPSP01_012385 [Paraphaeosphaeria sporulosa]
MPTTGRALEAQRANSRCNCFRYNGDFGAFEMSLMCITDPRSSVAASLLRPAVVATHRTPTTSLTTINQARPRAIATSTADADIQVSGKTYAAGGGGGLNSRRKWLHVSNRALGLQLHILRRRQRKLAPPNTLIQKLHQLKKSCREYQASSVCRVRCEVRYIRQRGSMPTT